MAKRSLDRPEKLLPRLERGWRTGSCGVRRGAEGLRGLIRGLGRAGSKRIRRVQIFIPADGIDTPIMGLAAEACHDGENGEGGTEGWMHKGALIIPTRARCARRGNRESPMA
jgi:hypothetical protein